MPRGQAQGVSNIIGVTGALDHGVASSAGTTAGATRINKDFTNETKPSTWRAV